MMNKAMLDIIEDPKTAPECMTYQEITSKFKKDKGHRLGIVQKKNRLKENLAYQQSLNSRLSEESSDESSDDSEY